LAACDVFAMTPQSLGPDVEGFGIVYLEAGLFGRPAIGSRSGGVTDAVRHEETGLLVDPGDAPGLAAAIRRLRDDPDLAERLGSRGRERVLGEFGWSRQARPLIEDLFPEIE
jgi:phosphatidylinositol alpha-1,6-mannosyltransferase